MSFISLAKRFIQKSNLLRLIIFLNTQSEFHFHGIKFLRSLGVQNAFLINQYSVISHWGFRLPIRETLFLSSLIEPFKNIKQRPFYISYNTYSYELAFSVPKFQAQTGEGLTRIRNFRDTNFCPMHVADTDGEGLTLLNMNYK